MSMPLHPVLYGQLEAPDRQHLVASAMGFDPTVECLKQALKDQDLWLLHEIDPQMLLQRGGYEIPPARQLLFFHPRYMARLLSAAPAAIVEAPLKLVVMQMPAGSGGQAGSVSVHCPDPRVLFGRHVGLAGLAQELADLCVRLLNTVAAEPVTAERLRTATIKPPFTEATARRKVQLAEDAWNSRDPDRVVQAYSENSEWRNRGAFFRGHAAIKTFLRNKWSKELDYRLMKELWSFTESRISVRFEYEWHDASGQWFRSHGNEHWAFDADGLMCRRDASINDVEINAADRRHRGPGRPRNP